MRCTNLWYLIGKTTSSEMTNWLLLNREVFAVFLRVIWNPYICSVYLIEYCLMSEHPIWKDIIVP